MANKGRTYAEDLVGALDRSAYNQQRDVIQNTYDTNWQNVQNQYKNLQDKLKLQQERANRDFAEGLVDVAEGSFSRQRSGAGNLANRGLAASGLTNILNQADTAQKGEDIGNLLKNVGDLSAESADKLSQANTKYTQESTNLLGKLADTLADVGDAETAAQNRYNRTLADIAGSMDAREANNALQAAQRAVSGSSSSSSRSVKRAENELEEFYKRATINEILASPDMSDDQKKNYLGIIFGIDNAEKATTAYNENANATDNYNKRLKSLEKAAEAEELANRKATQDYQRNQQNKVLADMYAGLQNNANIYNPNDAYLSEYINRNDPLYYNKNMEYPVSNYRDAMALSDLKNKGITYEDLAKLLYGNR